ncbi:MAG: HlyD family efflux transporter periplasmic adaptor subunit [Elainellaceae cyanobacterium]
MTNALNDISSTKQPHRWVALGAALCLSGAALWGVTQLKPAQVEAPAETAPAAPRTVTALGRLEPAGEVINLTAPTSTQESRVAALRISEGDRVAAGQIIAVLDNRDRLEAVLRQAQEQMQVAQAQLAQVEAGAKTGEVQAQRSEVARLEADLVGNVNTQRATIARLEAEVENARVEYQRYESLAEEGAVSASERDAKQLTYRTAQRQLQEAQAALARTRAAGQAQVAQARATLDQIAEVRPVDVAAAAAEVRSAQASVAEVKAQLEQTLVRSPRDGQIIEIYTYPGETIADEGLAALGQTQQMMAIAEVYQNDIAEVAAGQSVEITSPAIPQTLQGTVERIGLQVQQQRVVDEDPAANIDARVVEVHIDLDPASSEGAAGLSNLQITAQIQVD